MNDKILEDLKKDIESFFLNENNNLTKRGLLFLILFGLVSPFYLIYLKIKYLFIRH